LLGRLYRLKKDNTSAKNYAKAQGYFSQAFDNFNKIDHYRGVYLSLKDLHDLQQDQLFAMNYQNVNLVEKNQRLIPMYGKYKHKFML
jgi:hypothetical protein